MTGALPLVCAPTVEGGGPILRLRSDAAIRKDAGRRPPRLIRAAAPSLRWRGAAGRGVSGTPETLLAGSPGPRLSVRHGHENPPQLVGAPPAGGVPAVFSGEG